MSDDDGKRSVHTICNKYYFGSVWVITSNRQKMKWNMEHTYRMKDKEREREKKTSFVSKGKKRISKWKKAK